MKTTYHKAMNVFILTVIFVMLSLQDGACEKPTEQAVPRHLTEQRDGVIYLKNEKNPFTGTLKESPVDEGKLRFTFLNGVRHGHQRIWNADGKLSIEWNDVEGNRHGFARSWFYSGNLDREEYYNNSILLSGPFRTWHDNGKLAVVGQYEADEVRSGFWIWFHENGRAKKTGLFRNGKRDGLFVEWDEQGEEVSRKYFSADLDKEITEEEWFLSAVKRQSKSEEIENTDAEN